MEQTIGCGKCRGSGSVLAYSKHGQDPYLFGFRCDCSCGLNKRSSLPIYPNDGRWVLASEDSGLTDEYVYEMTKAKKTDDHRFQLRLSIWGKERFRASYERVKKNREGKEHHDASKTHTDGNSSVQNPSKAHGPGET